MERRTTARSPCRLRRLESGNRIREPMNQTGSRLSNGPSPSSDELLGIYRKVMLIYFCDQRMRALMKAGRLVGNYYSPRGQEVVAAAMAANLRADDYYVTIYRGLHDHLAKGVPLKDLWAEYW